MSHTSLFSPELLATAEASSYGTAVIPPCPSIVLVLLEEARKAEADYERIARLMTSDAGMASAALKLANSPLFGLRQRVTSVQQAVMVLGLRNLLQVIYGVALRQSVRGGDSHTMDRFWERSSYNAVACSQLAGRYPGLQPADAYNFGLFHDVGIAVLLQHQPSYRQTLKEANAHPQQLALIEAKQYRIAHTHVSALLANTWHLPQLVVFASYHHHDYALLSMEPTDDATSNLIHLVAIRVLSEHLVTRFLGFAADPEWDYAKQAVLEYLDLDDEKLAEVSHDMTACLRDARAGRR